MRLITTIAGASVSAALLAAAPAQAQFFDAPAAVAGGILGATAGAVGAATGGAFGTPYYNDGYGYGAAPASSYYQGDGYGYAPSYYGGAYAPGYGYADQPAYTGRSTYRSYRQYRRSSENPYN